MRIRKMNWFLRLIFTKDVIATCLAPWGIYFRDEETMENIYILRHEKIHWKQQCEMIIIFWYLWYFLEWLIKYLTPPVGAYEDISMEREANAFMYDPTYLITRKHYAWFKYITKKKK